MAKRAKSKAGRLYSNTQWDLVDAVQKNTVKLETINEKELPAQMVGMDQEQRKAYIAQQAEERSLIKAEIATLSEARERYVAEKRREAKDDEVKTVDDALVSFIRKQGKEKNFKFQGE